MEALKTKVEGMDIAIAYKLLKDAGYKVTAFYEDDKWFRVERNRDMMEFTYDDNKIVWAA